MENILERNHYGLQFSPSAVNYISSKRDSKKTQKKINENCTQLSEEDSPVRVLVIPTNEELGVARKTFSCEVC